jgi:hypothetical protein
VFSGLSMLDCPINWFEPPYFDCLFHIILIRTASSGISDQLRDIYAICMCCWNVATYKIINTTDMLHLSHVLPSQNYSNMMGVSSGVGTEDHSRAPEFITDFSGVRVARSLVFCVVLCILLLVLLLFFICLAIVLSVLLRVTDSDYSFGILDLRILINPLVS